MAGPTSGRRPTSTDVARAAGLSRATVGYVLNNVPHQSIPEATRQRVLEAAASLGYTPSAAARSLRSGRSDLVLCLLPDWPVGATVAGLLAELSAQLEAHGLTLVIHQRSGTVRPLDELWKSIDPAAILVLDRLADADTAALALPTRPAGLILQDAEGPETAAASYGAIGRCQVEHLRDRGRTRLAYAYPADPRLSSFARPRLDGVRQACADLGLAPPLVAEVALDPASTEAAVRSWAAADPPVDGICAYNDEVAVGLLGALRRAGRRVPADVGVVGVDDIPLAAVSDPPLTTVVTDSPALARHLAARVLAELGRPGPDVAETALGAARLRVRGSA